MATKSLLERDPPAVRDVRRWRATVSEDAGGTLEGLVDYLQRRHDANVRLLASYRRRPSKRASLSKTR